MDKLTNKQTSERFTYEIFGSESSICILAEDQYQSVASESGFCLLYTSGLPMGEIRSAVEEVYREGLIDDEGGFIDPLQPVPFGQSIAYAYRLIASAVNLY